MAGPVFKNTVGDATSFAIVGATLLNWLPAIAALFTILWTGMRIVQEWPAFKQIIISWFKKD